MPDSSGPIEADVEAIPPVAPAAPPPADSKKNWRDRLPKGWDVTNVVGISDAAWGKLAWLAAGVGIPATIINFCMVVAYAAGVSTHAPLVRDAGTIAMIVNFTIALGQVLVAGMLQLGTDFGLLFSAALAKSKNRGTPTLAFVLWLLCAANTIEMKNSMYNQIRDERIATMQRKVDEAPPVEVLQARIALEPYEAEAKPKPRVVPPTVETSEDDATNSQATVDTLKGEREEQVAARDEETKTGRKERWQEHDDRITAIDKETKQLRDRIATDRLAASERKTYDGALSKVSDWEHRPKITVSAIGYDSVLAISLRVWGPSLLSFISILSAFSTGKTAEDKRREAEERARRSEAARKGNETKKRNGKIVDVDFDPMEAASTEAKSLQFDPTAAPGATSPAHTKSAPNSKHPDKAGDGEVRTWTDIDMGGENGAE